MAENNTIAQVHYFDPAAYAEVINVLKEYSGFVLSEAMKPEPLDQTKLAGMLNVYIANCLKSGPQETSKPPQGSSCHHVFSNRAKNPGSMCGKTAKWLGIDGLPKCTAHKNSKPTKIAQENAPATSAAGTVFSYAQNAEKGRTIPQSLTTIQAVIEDQQTPAELKLEQAPDGRIFNKDTGLVFEQRAEGFIAVGTMNGGETLLLSSVDTNVCFANGWKWDQTRVSNHETDHSHTISIQNEHPLIQNSDQLITEKFNRTISNAELN